MTKRSKKSILPLMMLAVAVALATPALAGGIRAQINEPLIIGDQVFLGGEMIIQPVSRANLLSVMLDGRQVALLFRHDRGSWTTDSKPLLVFHRHEDGMLRFVGIRFRNLEGTDTRTMTVQIAAVARGLATRPDIQWRGETTLMMASR